MYMTAIISFLQLLVCTVRGPLRLIATLMTRFQVFRRPLTQNLKFVRIFLYIERMLLSILSSKIKARNAMF